tara:strand:- start:3887 stop:5014 length:1128 start_codon:yes stop_codon:yes gene_type:complete
MFGSFESTKTNIMKKSIVIKIPEPCHEDWAKMTATQKGKFCSVCTKEVFDLTSKTDEELVKILTENKNTCGRVKKSQLNREVKLERKSGPSLAPLAASMLLPLTLLSNNPKSENNLSLEKPMISLGIGRFSSSLNRIQIVTTGTIKDENGNPLKNVAVFSNETGAKEWTNKNGEYRIVTLDREQLTFQKESFIEQHIQLSNKSERHDIYLISESSLSTSVLGNFTVQKKEEKSQSVSFYTKGAVFDDTALPLPGANVIIKGTSKRTQTDFDGNYTIETKPGDVLVFSYVGFETKEITVSNVSTTININLDPDGEILGEVVIAGGISWEDYQPKKDDAWKEKAKQAYKNTLKFRKLKIAEKREKRKAKQKAKRNNE